MTEAQQSRGRLKVVAIALLFFGPLGVATWMYSAGVLTPDSRSNSGDLLVPIVNLPERLPDSPLADREDRKWLMLYRNTADCDAACRDALYRMRQIRLMLGNDMSRVERVFLHGDTAPDRVLIDTEHNGLETITDKGLDTLLGDKRPTGRKAGGIWLIDPLGNLVMYFPPDLEPREVVDDMEHLLDLSRIG